MVNRIDVTAAFGAAVPDLEKKPLPSVSREKVEGEPVTRDNPNAVRVKLQNAARHLKGRACASLEAMAEGVGFEPTIPLSTVYTLSRRAP